MNTTTKLTIPLLDLQAQYEPIKELIKEKMLQTFDSKYFINGPEVELLEEKINTYCGTKHSVGVSSGSDALIIALMALDISAGDEVITTPFTFFATAGAIARVGAKPVFCDINPDTFNIDVTQIESKITSKTKAIMPVHLFGHCADMDSINTIANERNLYVIEDAAQDIGSSYTSADGTPKKAGDLGTVGCFSFFPSKNLGACGDAGIVTTNDTALYEKIKSLRMHGETQRYHHKYIGGNFRIDALQAGIISIKLDFLESQHDGRRANAKFYDTAISSCSTIKTPVILDKCKSIYNQYSLISSQRDKLKDYLTQHTIGNNIYYPIPLHLQECFEYLGYKQGDFPVAERVANEIISIPIYSELSNQQLDYVAKTINSFVNA